MSAISIAHEQPPTQHLPSPIVGLNRTRGEWTAHLADGRTAPISEKRARAILATARVDDRWSFGIYSNWVLHGG